MTKYAIYSSSKGFYNGIINEDGEVTISWNTKAHAVEFNSYGYARGELDYISGGKDNDMEVVVIS